VRGVGVEQLLSLRQMGSQPAEYEVFLRREVPEEGPLRDEAVGADVLDPHAVVAAFEELVQGHFLDLVSGQRLFACSQTVR
jgi:hypothetical protein